MRRKIILRFSIMIVIMALSISAFELYNLRNSGIKSAISKAEAISEVIKNGLTAHMINGNMDQRDTFINSIATMDIVEKIWITRSKAIDQQFGDALANEIPRDDIDKNVLNSGKMQYVLNETISKTSIRVTIPYNAASEGKLNCLNCHNVKYGQTLGAVSIILDITNVKQSGLQSIYIISAITLFSILIIIYLTSHLLTPYITLFEELSSSIEKAVLGNFVRLQKPKGLSSDMILVANEYNSLITKFKATFSDIDKKLKGFIGNHSDISNNPLDESTQIISNLSNIYQFKKEIELDDSKEEIYNRLSQIFKNRFRLNNFAFIEIDHLKERRRIIHKEGDLYFCSGEVNENPELCRAGRTKHDVISVNYHKSCPYFTDNDNFYYCTNIEISKNISLIINFVLQTKKELDNLKDNIPFIKSYIHEAAPSIEVKLLMNALKESAFKDGLTDLYNRKFLDEHIKKLAPQTVREGNTIAVLMLDMDHFKAVNDEYGHDIGDKVLKELAQILTENVRESDLVVRFGGEEFIILLVGIANKEDALTVANKIRIKVSENEIDVYAGSKLRKTISIGMSMFPDSSNTFDGALKNADIALYEAKKRGRNQVVVYEENQKSSVDLF